MSKLLHADFYRLWKTKSYYICLAVAAAIAIFGAVMTQVSINIMKAATKTEPSMQQGVDKLVENTKTGGFGYLGTCMGDNTIPLLVAIVVSLFVCMYFSSGAIKNAHGFHRSEIYGSVLITSAVSALIMMVVYMLFSFAAASVLWGVGKVDTDIVLGLLKMIGTVSLLLIGCVSLFVMVAMLIRNSGGTIAINIGSFIVVPLLLGIINNLLIKSDVVLVKYWIVNAGAYVAQLKPINDDIIRSLIVAGCYIVVTTAIGLFTFQKRDIK
jgi:ABC-2 type transport system permease protein